ncbi:MAG: transposase [Janthinobacterium lividum]
MQPYRQVTDEEWARVEPLIPELKYNPTRDPRGRPMTSRRDCLNATIWVMYSGASWQTLPRRYPSYQTCHRSFKAWYDAGVLHRIAHTLFGTAAQSFLEVVSARIRSGTKARQALNAAAAASVTAASKPSSSREAASGVRGARGGHHKTAPSAKKAGVPEKRTNGSRTLATQAVSEEKASPRKAVARKDVARKDVVREPTVRVTAVRKAATAQGSPGADRAGAERTGNGRVRSALPRSTPARPAAEEASLVGKITPRDTPDAPLSVRKTRRVSAGVRAQEMAGSA